MTEYNAQSNWIQGLVQGANNTVVNIFSKGYGVLKESLGSIFGSMTPTSIQNDAAYIQLHREYIDYQKAINAEIVRLETQKLENQAYFGEKAVSLQQEENQIRQREVEVKSWFFAQYRTKA